MRGIGLPTLPIRVLDFLPRSGEPGERLTAFLDRCPELLDLNIKIGVGMKILDTVPWISREYSQLSATLPSFPETGWYSPKVPLYIISLENDGGIEIPIQSWCFGQFEYKTLSNPTFSFDNPNHINNHTINLNHINNNHHVDNNNNNISNNNHHHPTNYSMTTPTPIETPAAFKHPFLVQNNLGSTITSYDLNSSIPMNNEINGLSINGFNQNFSGANDLPSARPTSLSQQVLQRVDQRTDSNHSNLTELEENLFNNQHIQDFSGINMTNFLDKPNTNTTTTSSMESDSLKDIFNLPDYQPRFRMSTYNTHLNSSLENARMSTYNTHLKSSLENANYFPSEAIINENIRNDPFMALSQENHHQHHQQEQQHQPNDGGELPSNFDPINFFFNSELFDPNTKYNDELKALMSQNGKSFLKPQNSNSHSPSASFSSLSTPPNVAISQPEPSNDHVTNPTNVNSNKTTENEPKPSHELPSSHQNKRQAKNFDIDPTKKIKASPQNEEPTILGESKESEIKEEPKELEKEVRVIKKPEVLETSEDTGVPSPPPSDKLYPKLQPKPTSETITPTNFPRKTSLGDMKLGTSISNIMKGSSYHHLDKQPYNGVLNRADLVLLTDISEMVTNWTSEEKEAGRRLIHFQRRHEENTLYCQFEPISQATYLKHHTISPNSDEGSLSQQDINQQIVISVIYWPGLSPTPSPDDPTGSSDYYVTSVDVVNLLEGLLGVTFTLEEKNRIRRNLELFSPLTVGKGSSTTGDLFRQIMAFPIPRPRNIEKGIKVFPYHQLPSALRKVVGKHTASRSSTLRVNLLPLKSNTFPTEPRPHSTTS